MGNRVSGGPDCFRFFPGAFTTNFDSIVEKAVAEVAGKSISAYHLEGSHAANNALNNEEYPIYCKLHGDFRYDSLKNLPRLWHQNAAFSECLVNAGNRLGFIVTGYSGRDQSVLELFNHVLTTNNPFPHGLYWTGLKGSGVLPAVEALLEQARKKGVKADFVPIETFDSFMLRLWRNIADKSPELDREVRRAKHITVQIPIPNLGRAKPLLRLNALPVTSHPSTCLSLTFTTPKDWDDIRRARSVSDGGLIIAKGPETWCWASQDTLQKAFGNELVRTESCDLPQDLDEPNNLWVKSLVERALVAALARDRPLVTRGWRSSSVLIANSQADHSRMEPLVRAVGKITGIVPGLTAPATEEHPEPERVSWAEAVRLSLDFKNGQLWLLIDPDVWIWPQRARRLAEEFLDRRRANRFNATYNTILSAWIQILLGTDERNTEVRLSAFEKGNENENPSFTVATRTAFSRRVG